MFKKYHLLNRKNIFYFLLFTVFCCLFFIIQNNLPSPSVNRIPANVFMNPYVLPVGTQMVVPSWIMQQYQSSLQRRVYGNVLDYLIYNYSVSAPDGSGESTYYIPLSISSYDYDDDDDYDVSPIRKGDIYMVDVTKVKVTSSAPTPVEPPVEPPSGDSPVPPPVKPPVESSAGDPPAAPPVEPPLSAEGGEVEKPADSSQASEEVQFTTTDLIDPSTAPPPPPPGSKPKPDPDPLAERPPVSCEESDAHTEADSPCVECAGLRETEVEPFLDALETKVDDSHGVKHFPGVIRDICNSCFRGQSKSRDVKDFFKYIEDRANEEGVPSEVLFALVMRESNGNCKAGGDGGKSVGLFQLNTGNSTCLEGCKEGALEGVSAKEMQSVCEKGHYHKDYGTPGDPCPGTPSFSKPKICLNNPYCNFEEAFHLLKDQKWGMGNNGEQYRPTSKKWADLKAEERNKWRNAIVSYNGRKYIEPAEQLMRDTLEDMSSSEKQRWINAFGVSSEGDVNSEKTLRSLLDNWEFKRMFFIKRYLSSLELDEQSVKAKWADKTDAERQEWIKSVRGLNDKVDVSSDTIPGFLLNNEDFRRRFFKRSEAVLRNLAHVESITGREVSGGFAESAICQWVRFEEKNPNLSCK